MLAVLFGAASALFFGAADFIGGFASRRIVAMLVTAIAALAGVIALTIAAPFDGGVWHAETWIGGVLTGIASCLGIWFLYSAYSVGPMTTLSPIVAIVSTIVPMFAGLFGGETFSTLGWIAVAVGIVAIGLVAAAPDERKSKARPVDMVKSGVAGAFLGLLYIYLDGGFWNVYVDEAGLTPLTANRITCTILAFGVVAIMFARGRKIIIDDRPVDPRSGVPAPELFAGSTRGAAVLAAKKTAVVSGQAKRVVLMSALGLAMLSGTLDATANSLFTFGLGFGDLAVLSVVSGLYPAVTIAMAYLVLRERPNRLQSLGIVLALVALVGLSLA